MRAIALAAVVFCLPAGAAATDGPGGVGSPVPASLARADLGPCDPNSGGSSLDRIAACTDLVRIGKTDASIYVARASAYADSGNRDAAIADLSAAILQRPNTAAAYSLRGALYLQEDEFRDGLVDLDRAVALAPDDEATLRTRAFAWDQLGAYPAAVADYTTLLALSGDDSYRYFRGFAYFRQGNEPAALADFGAILDAPSPTLAGWGYRGRGEIREHNRSYAEALADYAKALALDPSDDRAFAGRCRVQAALSGATVAGCASAVKDVARP